MSTFQDLNTPPPSPTSPTPFPLWKRKSQEDVVKHKRPSSAAPPAVLLKMPQTSAGGLLTPPDTPVGKQSATHTSPATIIDCPISKTSFLLAQASLATELFASSTTEFKFRTSGSPREGTRILRFGTGLDGCFNRTRGFLGDQGSNQGIVTTSKNASTRSVQRLPASLEAWEAVHGNLPRLLRAGRVRQAVDALGERVAGERDPWDDLEQHHLARAALVLSSLAHAYMFGEDQGKCKGDTGRSQLPRHVVSMWERVSAALGRPMAGRVPADDILNNAMGDDTFSLTSTYFDLPEERLSSGLQGTMEAVFAPALSTMALAQSGVLADQPEQVAACLESLAARIVKCAHVFEAMTPRDTKNFDPVVWIKTHPAISHPVMPGELGNSGVDAPLFHALDAFIGRHGIKGDLGGMQSDRRAKLPANIRAFLDSLGDGAESTKDYVAACRAQLQQMSPEERPQYRRLSAAWDGLLQMYVWFLERHRVKAIGVTGVSLNTGLHSTSSGVNSNDQSRCAAAGKSKMRPETMLSIQMKKGMVSRLGGRPPWQDAHVQSQSVYQDSVVVDVKLDANLPLEAGDRVQVWPARKRKQINRTSSHQRRLRASSPPGDDDASPCDEDDVEPRFYSVARAEATDSGRGGMTITLTVGQHSPEGRVSSFLGNAVEGTHLRLRPWPSPRFRQPHDLTKPLVLVGQGSGVGPLVGFLHERATRVQRLDESQDDVGKVGEVLLVVAAKTRRHVPCPLDSLKQLTRGLPLTVVLALSQERHLMIRSGTWTQLPQGGRRVTHHLAEYRDSVQRLVKEKGGHVFVCGSSEFGATVMSSLGLGQPRQRQKQPSGESCAQNGNEASCDDDDRTEMPSPPAHWDQLHQDLFSMVRRPSNSRSSSSSSPSRSPSATRGPENNIISRSDLAAHNSITSCWTSLGGKVYDLTSFLVLHPGGPKTLLESAGTVADERFDEVHGGPHAQEIRGYLQNYVIGRLSTATPDSATEMTAERVIDALVRMQNALTNNSAFSASRGPVPFYVYENALLVFANSLHGVAGILSDDAADCDFSRLRETLANVQAMMQKASKALKDRCKCHLASADAEDSSSSSFTLLGESEAWVQRLYREPIKKVHAALDACKKSIGEIDTGSKVDSSSSTRDVDDDESADRFVIVLERFYASLISIAEDLFQQKQL
ncbi:cytochrome b5-like heme steroid binding domain-containing protein [Colletotrichum musicola]|uniref:NADPH--hemoprotein reductase n=1 Tax=Colletotrichum musicola TaxID=2175873 RepID=A0A8H6U8Z8_9PEZI|nr:cytochrome b5-like heme steroid binding domain-containing protein [Colletotrichum musicola]